MLGRAANGEHLLGSNSQRDYIMYTTGDNCENTSTSYSIIEEVGWGGGREGSSSSSPSSQNCKNCLYACLCRVVHNMAWIVVIQGWAKRWAAPRPRLRDARVLHPTQGRHCPSARPSLYSITGAALLFRPSSGSHKKAQIRSPCVKVRETPLHCRDSGKIFISIDT